ncbi:HAMP domain-containing histidine kinase [Aquibacillus koreensis]|uniref:histidine kinase n=1 Tax=Aquibacillus koreensis TaxID=279446 RepID=A0A9X4AHZ1_9BACI|nr:HAMP domain-containing sensor histidine kinase [Aquibacillus koreensis]MCT2535748.1 HAMP domain-containing histidine kinase [Aquibacillus koreensis]MDC3420204.1 HAMP domain-containing histidine kinase [Aquibacillus koreensis]
MKLNSVVTKLGATILFLQLIILIPLGYIIVQIVSNYSYNEVESQLIDLSRKYAQSFTSVNDQHAWDSIYTYTEVTGMKAVLIDPDGRIISKAGLSELKEEGLSTPREQSLLKSGTPINTEYINNDTQYLKVAQPIMAGSTYTGSIYLLSSLDSTYQSVYNITKLVILASIGAVVLAIGFTFFMSIKLASPLLQMEKATKRIADKKDFSTRVTYKGNDEIGSLANAINNLSQTLETYQTNRNEFFANITHELKTPLTYIKGYTNALKKKLYQSEEEKETYLDIIEKETNQMNNLMDDLMDLSKIEEGKLNLHKEDIDITEVIDMVINKIMIKAKNKGITVSYEAPPEGVVLYADGQRMEQILTNLLENATRYTEKGNILVRVFKHSKQIKITVEDTGIGISEKDVPYLFERFYRVDKSRSRSHGGTGLGLSIVKKLVDIHDGAIEIQSKLGEGTTFILSFPMDQHK